MIGAAAGRVVRQKLRELGDDPLTGIIKITRNLGLGLITGGVGMGIAGYFLKATATSAINDEMAQLQQLAAIFSNFKTPAFSPAATGTAPVDASITGVQNFFSDAWTNLQAAGSDLASIGGAIGTVAEDIGIAVMDVGKALLALVQNGPRMLWDALVGVMGGGLADLMNWAFPYLILIGAITLGISILLSLIRWGAEQAWETARPVYEEERAKWTERVQKKLWRPLFARIFRNGPEPPPGAPSPIVGRASAEPDAQKRPQARPDESAGTQQPSAPESPAPLAAAPAPAPAPVVSPPVPQPETPSQALPAGITRSELQDELGRAMTDQRDRIRAMLRRPTKRPAPAPARRDVREILAAPLRG